MEWAKKYGLTALTTKESTSMERSTEKADSTGPMGLPTMASLWITIFREKECTPGLMAESTRDNGSAIKCMVTESSPGLMDAGTKANMLTIKRKATGYSSGPMVVSTMVSGSTVSSMERALTSLAKAK